MKKLTTEEFIKRSKEIHGSKYDYSMVEYTRNSAKVKIICPEHGAFEQVASSHLLGFGCQKCGSSITWKKRGRMTTEEFITKSREVHGEKYDYSKTIYKRSREKVCIICPKHGEFWQLPHVHLNGRGCDKCGDEVISNKLSLGKENFIKKANEVHNGKYIYPEYLIYKNNQTKVPIICPEHGEFWQLPSNHLKGADCPLCGKEKLKKPKVTKEEFIKRANDKHNGKYDYSKVEYKDTLNKVCIICHEHGEFYQTPKNHMNGQGCPDCRVNLISQKKTYTLNDFIMKCNEVHNNKYDYSKVEYINSKTPVIIVCPKHGEFSQMAVGHLNGTGCPKCGNSISKAEDEIFEFIKTIDDSVEQRVKSIIKPYELDIYSSKHKIAIEYNGIIWHSDLFGKDSNYHLLKTNKCKENNIRLIHIFEDEYRDKKEIVLSRLSDIFDKTKNRIYARKCEINEITDKISSEFLEENHLQGKIHSSFRFGLYYNNELVAVMTFGKLRKSLGSKSNEGEYELLRYCSKLNTTVIGGAGKLLKHFIKEVNPKRIVSYADKRWSNGGLYYKLGFKHIRDSKPNYFYVVGRERENRFKYRKSELIKQGFDPNKSEHEIMLERGIPRIYDCGAMVFEMKL